MEMRIIDLRSYWKALGLLKNTNHTRWNLILSKVICKIEINGFKQKLEKIVSFSQMPNKNYISKWLIVQMFLNLFANHLIFCQIINNIVWRSFAKMFQTVIYHFHFFPFYVFPFYSPTHYFLLFLYSSFPYIFHFFSLSFLGSFHFFHTIIIFSIYFFFLQLAYFFVLSIKRKKNIWKNSDWFNCFLS